jgi:hypothetical protein
MLLIFHCVSLLSGGTIETNPLIYQEALLPSSQPRLPRDLAYRDCGPSSLYINEILSNSHKLPFLS